MRRLLAAVACTAFLFSTRDAAAQDAGPRPRSPVGVSPSVGYAFASGVAVPRGTVAIAGSAAFSTVVDVRDWYTHHLEFEYLAQPTHIELQSEAGTRVLYGVLVQHLRAGLDLFPMRGPVQPFLGLTVGMAWFAPSGHVRNEVWPEASIHTGVELRLASTWAIRLQATATSIFLASGSRIFCTLLCDLGRYEPGISNLQLALVLGPTFVL